VAAIVSIRGQREYAVDAPHISQRLVLSFDDTEAPSATDLLQASRVRLRQREAASYGLVLKAPVDADARALIDFAASIRGMSGAMLCQCLAGVSRSSAAAMICLCVWAGAGQEVACAQRVRRVRPSASPNPYFVALADAALGRRGAMIDAVNREFGVS